METANDTAMHVNETKALCSSRNCTKTNKNDEITREREEELLYGNNEDVDDEDALSDDSIRLRVSDDEGEEQQTTSRAANNEITKQDSTDMELGSDVHTRDSTEGKIVLKGESLSNGKCTIENHVKLVDDGRVDIHEDLSRADHFFANKQDEYKNGDNDGRLNASLVTSFVGSSSVNQWNYSGHFGHYSRRGNRNFVPRQQYAMTSCNKKYNNENTYFGRGRNCGRGYSLYHARESHVSFDDISNDDKSNPRISPAETMMTKNTRCEGVTVAPKENVEDTRIDSHNSSDNNDSGTKLNETIDDCKTVKIEPLRSSQILITNDNAEAAFGCSTNADSTSGKNQEELISIKCEASLPFVRRESRDDDVEKASTEVTNKAEVASSVVESTIVDEIFGDDDDDSSTEPRTSIFEEEEAMISNGTSNADGGIDRNVVKNCKNVTLGRIMECKNDNQVSLGKTSESKCSKNAVSEETNESTNEEKIAAERTIDSTNDEKIALERTSEFGNDETIVESDKMNELKNIEKFESEETRESNDDDKIASERIGESEINEEVASEKMNKSENNEQIESEKVNIRENDETLESEKTNVSSSVDKVASEIINESTTNDEIIESEKIVDSTTNAKVATENLNESTSELVESKIIGGSESIENSREISDEYLPNESSTANRQEDDRSIYESNEAEESRETEKLTTKNRENDGERIDKDENPEEAEKTLETSCQVEPIDEKTREKSVESPFDHPISSAVKEEKSENIGSQQATREISANIATDETETNDEKKVSSIVDEETTASESKVSLTDNDNKNIDSRDDNDDSRSENVKTNDDHNVMIVHCALKRTSSELLLDEMELSKRIRIGRKRSDDTSESSVKEIDDSMTVSMTNVTDEIDKTSKNDSSIVDNTVTNSKTKSPDLGSEENTISNNVAEKSTSSRNVQDNKKTTVRSEDPDNDDDNNEEIDDCEVIEVPVRRKQKRSRRSLNSLRDNAVSHEDSQEMENVRQKRKTAQNAEEIIRKEFLGNTDSESNDSLSKFITINHKTNNNLRSASPPTLKRSYVDDEVKGEGTTLKKLKQDVKVNGNVSLNDETIDPEKKHILRHVRNFFRRDATGSLCKLKQEELEELLIQKVVETLTMRDEIGKLREQAKVSERNQEATRLRCQQLAKQIKDFEMVLSRYKSDLRTNPDSKTVVPIKINRSVGLQVNFVTDHGIQNLRQLQQVQKAAAPVVNGMTVVQQQPQQQQPQQQQLQLQQQHQQQQQQQQRQQQQQNEQSTSATPAKRSIKVRSPRRPELPVIAPVPTPVSSPVNGPHLSSITPAALVVSKSATDSRPSVTPTNQQATVAHPQLISSSQAILANGNITNQQIRQAPTLQASKPKNSDLIDLTQEEDKTKTAVVPQNTLLATTLNDISSSVSSVQKISPRFHTVLQTIPGSMAITAQSGIRVVQPSSQPTPTALVNNMNAPRLTYVTMQSGMVPRQVVLTSTPTPIRPSPGNSIRTSFPISGTITNSTVRVIPTTATTTVLYKHPAALPESLHPMSHPSWKLAPPAPSLKISKVANGIVLSWNMALSEKYAEIASYQLYAYQEITGIAPSSTLWKKVGDVRALPLPMACTLTQFSEGNNYYFAVRAVDKHSRLGQYSQPGNISL